MRAILHLLWWAMLVLCLVAWAFTLMFLLVEIVRRSL
jgi:hypothetical protein